MSELETWRRREPNLALARKLTVAVWAVTAVVLALVGAMRRVKIEVLFDLGFLPPLHAALNTGAALALVLALLAIKRGRVARHRRWIYVAMGCSLLFLLSYVTYHFTTPETMYGDTNRDGELQPAEKEAAGAMRLVYLAVLVSHIVLAALSLPFILLTFVYGYTNQLAKHRRLARRVFPVWLYVAVTGPAVYLMLRPFY